MRAHQQRTWLAFSDLRIGERFRFVYGTATGAPERIGDRVFTKTSAGWYTDGRNHFRTGPTGAVQREATDVSTR